METANHTSPAEIFTRLKAVLQLYAPPLVIVKDDPGNFSADTAYVMKNKRRLAFGAVIIEKNYVSFHLLPVYACPTFLENMSDGLRARMQGKGCFNFKRVDTVLFEELAKLTQAGFERFQSEELVERICRR